MNAGGWVGNTFYGDLDSLRIELDSLRAERDTLTAERDKLLADHSRVRTILLSMQTLIQDGAIYRHARDEMWEKVQSALFPDHATSDDPLDLNVCIREPFASVDLEAAPREEGKAAVVETGFNTCIVHGMFGRIGARCDPDASDERATEPCDFRVLSYIAPREEGKQQ